MSKLEKMLWGLEAVLLVVGVAMNLVNADEFSLYLVVAGLLLQVVYFQIQLINTRNTKPHVVMDDEVYIEDVSTTRRTYQWLESPQVYKHEENLTTDAITNIRDPNVLYRRSGDPFIRYSVRFRNTLENQLGLRNAENVHARITFRNKEDYKEFSHDSDRWVGYPTPDRAQIPIEIEVNGDPQDLYLIIQDSEKNDCYIFSDESYTQDKFDPCKEGMKLSFGNYEVKIVLADNKGWHNTYSLTMIISSGNPVFEVMKRF
jgi:hypothetical protein